MSKLTSMADGFRPKQKPVYEAEPVNLPEPHMSPFNDFHISQEKRSVVDAYCYEKTKANNARYRARYRRSTHR